MGTVLLAKPRCRCGHGSGSEGGAEMSLEETMSGNGEVKAGEGRMRTETARSSPAHHGGFCLFCGGE